MDVVRRGSIEHRWVWTTPRYEAVSLWIPPGCPELAEPYAARLEPLLDELLGPRSALLVDVFNRFENAHPREEEHFYLSLLGTHPDHRGRGLGMGLLAENLALIDAAGAPAYLESSNPVNLGRYQSVGFERSESSRSLRTAPASQRCGGSGGSDPDRQICCSVRVSFCS